VTITLPDPGKRFMSMQVISEDHYTIDVVYAPGRHTYTKDSVGSRYVFLGVRTLANPEDPGDRCPTLALLQTRLETIFTASPAPFSARGMYPAPERAYVRLRREFPRKSLHAAHCRLLNPRNLVSTTERR
jgi:hypothetical protein